MVDAITNLSAMIGLSAMAKHSRELNTAMERLATGKKINRASDDPAGMAVGDSMAARLKTISKKIDGLVFEDKRLGAIEGAQSVLSDLLQELNGLVVQSAGHGGLSPKEREANQVEADSILQAIDHIAVTTTFNGEKIIEYLSSKGLGVRALGEGGEFNLVDGDAEKAQHAVQSAIDSLATQQAGVGIRAKDIGSQINALRTEFENTSAARSQIYGHRLR